MTATDVASRLLTADDLLRLSSQGVRGELIRGVLCETMGNYIHNLTGRPCFPYAEVRAGRRGGMM